MENLSATRDQFACIDFTDNSIVKIDELPKLTKLNTLILTNNRVSKVAPDFAKLCPNLETLILTANKINSMSEIDNIASCTDLIRLSLVDNLVTKIKHYRLYCIFKMPSLRVLDFHKVKLAERREAAALFGGKSGSKLIDELHDKSLVMGENPEYLKAFEELVKDGEKKKKLYVAF